jgi:cell division protein FtsZ
MAIMGIGAASGENRAVDAAERAISHPLLEDINIGGAKGVLMNITSSSDITMEEMTEASERIYNEVGDEADIIWGAVIDDDMGEEMRVTVIATGIGAQREEKEPVPAVQDPTYGGKVRDITPADMGVSTAVGDDLDEPTFQRVRRQKAVNESAGSLYKGYKGMVIDHNDLDVPTFLRRKAD